MKLWRADKRDFNVGDVITSANEFASLNPKGSNEIEQVFEHRRPDGKPNRVGCLYLFENEVVAKQHWSKMADGKLYEVELRDEPILHRGDMRFVDAAFASSDISTIEKCAIDYWEGIETEKPRIEILATRATIVQVISKDQVERRTYLMNWPPP
ncbi:hypothetical protein HC024_17790 [Methylococcaceae bacterium WWC4]|nr:hypothetical protein [Methylococcaceae bacterium WWC4]